MPSCIAIHAPFIEKSRHAKWVLTDNRRADDGRLEYTFPPRRILRCPPQTLFHSQSKNPGFAPYVLCSGAWIHPVPIMKKNLGRLTVDDFAVRGAEVDLRYWFIWAPTTLSEAGTVFGDVRVSVFSACLPICLSVCVSVCAKKNKKLIRRWDSERELSLRRFCTRSKIQ